MEDIDSNDSSYNSNNNSENGIIISDDNSQREIGDELSELDSDGDHEGD